MNLQIYPTIKKASELTGKTQKEITAMIKKRWGKNIKTTCCICGNKIKYSVARYYSRGNSCSKCLFRCSTILKARFIYDKLVKGSKDLKDNTEALKAILKRDKIKPEELFLSIKFYNSATTLLNSSISTLKPK